MNKNMERKAIVISEHTLGIVYGNEIQILRASVLKGSPYPGMGTVPFDVGMASNDGKWRPATVQDFREFRVLPHPDWL